MRRENLRTKIRNGFKYEIHTEVLWNVELTLRIHIQIAFEESILQEGMLLNISRTVHRTIKTNLLK